MLRVLYTKPFLKQYSKLSSELQAKTKATIHKFQKNPKDSSLKAHKLEGKLKNQYSFSVDYKTRIVFELWEKGKAVFLKVGDHDVYK